MREPSELRSRQARAEERGERDAGLTGSKPRRISVQITVTEQQMVKVELLLFQNLATPPSTTGSTTFLRLESGQDLVTELTHIASNFKAKGTWLLPGLLIILGLGS